MTTTTADPFGDLVPGPDGLARGLHRYRQLARQMHPDLGTKDHAAMAGLNVAWEAAQRRLGGAPRPEVTITSRKHTYTVLRPLVAGDVADLHVAETGSGLKVVLKVARNPKDADLLAAEVASLKAIHADHEDGFNGWFPEVMDSFAFAAPGKQRRRATAMAPLRGLYNLDEVVAAHRYMQPRDAAWVARRVLHSLAQAHHAGRVHGGLVPAHVMVHPTGHRVVLVGWGGSVGVGQPLRVRVSKYRHWYPDPEDPASPGTDLFMFGHLLRFMAATGETAQASALRAFGRGCSLPSGPTDAHDLLGEFDDLLERLWGPRKYHEFTMPGPSRI